MKTIALLGSPGSGKSKIAEAIKDELIRGDGQCNECNTPVEIVDNYTRRIEDDGEYEVGLDGGYMANISVAVERYNRERFVGKGMKPKTMITCGTVIETSVYTSQHFERTLRTLPTDEEKMEEAIRMEACVKMLAVLYMDTFKYGKAFYVPTLQPPKDERWMTFERNLQAAFQAYNAPVAPLLIESYEDEEDLLRQQVEKILHPGKER